MIYDEQRLYLIQERLPEEACFRDIVVPENEQRSHKPAPQAFNKIKVSAAEKGVEL